MSNKDSFSNFWNSCPLKKEYLPTRSCPRGKPNFDKDGKIVEEPSCAWWINSKEHHFCFWKYINDKSDADGFMQEMLQSDLAKLFGCSSTKVHFMLKTALKELKELLSSGNIATSDISDPLIDTLQSIDIDSINSFTIDKLK